MNKYGAGGLFAAIVTVVVTAPAYGAEQTSKKDAANETALEEVVVTATKRNENLLKVPITVNVLTTKDIEAAGITRAADFLNSTPNVTFSEDNTGETFVGIRGQTTSRNSDPNVAIVVDGVTLTSVRDFNQDLFDLDQIEVLKGPQSALYGRNAAAGAIVINTKPPADNFEGSMTVGKGNFDSSRFTGSISGPINSDLKYRAGISFRRTDGSYTNLTTGEKMDRASPTLGRLRLLYQPGDKRLSVDLKLGFESNRGGTLSYVTQAVGLPLGNFDGKGLNTQQADEPYLSNVEGNLVEKYYEGTLKVDYAFDFAKLTSITAVSYLDNFFAGPLPPYLPGDIVNASYAFKDKNYSQEFRLTSPSDQRFRWQVGVYALHFLRNQYEVQNQNSLGVVPADSLLILGPTNSAEPTTSYGHQYYTTTSFAPFASIQYDILDTLHLGLAGRYDTEIRTVTEVTPDVLNPLNGLSYNACVQLTGQTVDHCHNAKSFHQFEPKASLSFDVTSDATVYFSYGKGFKSGGFNPIGSRQALLDVAAAAGQPASSVFVQDQFDKEVSTSYEVGAKVRLFDRHLAINAAVFQTNINGAEQFQFIPSKGLQTTVSIDKIKSKGFDIDFTALLPTGTTIFGGYGYTDAKVEEFAASPSFVGNAAPSTFKYTVNFGVTQSFAVSDNLKFTPRIELNRQGPIWWDVNNTPGTERDPINLLKGRLTLSGSKNWDVSLYGDNLLNKQYFQIVVPILSVFGVNHLAPLRTYGVEGTVKF